MENPAVGKILGMLMAYAVSFLGLLLAYYNYKKRVVNAAPKTGAAEKPKAEPVPAPASSGPAKPLAAKSTLAVAIPATAAVVIALIFWAASVSGDKGSGMDNIMSLLPGMIFPAVVFAISYYLTWLLYKHFAGGPGTGESK